MSRISILSLSTLFVAAACSAPQMTRPRPEPDDASASGVAAARAVEADHREGAPQAAASADVQATVAEVFGEPAFARQVAQSYLRGSEIDPPLTLRQAELRTEVLGLLAENELDKAASRLQSRQGEKETAVFDFMLGTIRFQQERWADAIAELQVAVGKYPKYRRAWRTMGFAQMRLGNYAAAARALVEVVTLGGNDAQTIGFLATMYAQARDFVAAEAAFRTVTMLEPDRERWRVMLAKTLFGQARYAEGSALIGALLEKQPERADLWLLQADAFANLGRTRQAAENLEIADGLGGSTWQSLAMLGNIYFNDGLHDLAVDAYLRAMAKDGRGGHALPLQVANRLAAASAYDESARLVKGIETAYRDELDKPARTELLKLRARLAVASGATDEQVALLQQIVDDNPLDGDALLQLGRHYQSVGDDEKAILRYQQAAQNDAFAAPAKVLHAQLLVNQSKFGAALPLLRQAQQLDRRDDVQRLLEYVERAAARSRSGS